MTGVVTTSSVSIGGIGSAVGGVTLSDMSPGDEKTGSIENAGVGACGSVTFSVMFCPGSMNGRIENASVGSIATVESEPVASEAVVASTMPGTAIGESVACERISVERSTSIDATGIGVNTIWCGVGNAVGAKSVSSRGSSVGKKGNIEKIASAGVDSDGLSLTLVVVTSFVIVLLSVGRTIGEGTSVFPISLGVGVMAIVVADEELETASTLSEPAISSRIVRTMSTGSNPLRKWPSSLKKFFPSFLLLEVAGTSSTSCEIVASSLGARTMIVSGVYTRLGGSTLAQAMFDSKRMEVTT